ncbi:MAG: hypothetical protein K2N48_05830 [Muribaculaceae bacterium]|nr:hypothetical protein [Muribaculaceae bacterium]
MKETDILNSKAEGIRCKEKDMASSFDFTLSKRWISGIPYEVAFWRSFYRNRSARKALFSWSQYGKECELDDFDVASFIKKLKRDNPVIVDVGCALSYMFSNIIGGEEYKVTYLDPLAPYYNKILDDYSLHYPRITFGMGETLRLHFPGNSVSMIHIRNALDHSVRPIMVIWQALMCLHIGGVLYLNHKPNEAEHEAYVGFHQYNVDCRDGRLFIWNKDESIDIGETLLGYADVKASVTQGGRIVGVITKTAEIPEDHESVKESGMYASGMLETLLTYFHKTSNALSYQSRCGFFTIGHGFMRMLPGGIVRKIKQIISGKKAEI